METALSTSGMPQPKTSSTPFSPKSREVVSSTARTTSIGMEGAALLITASAPLTCGAANEVPLLARHWDASASGGQVAMNLPGATRHHIFDGPQPLEK